MDNFDIEALKKSMNGGDLGKQKDFSNYNKGGNGYYKNNKNGQDKNGKNNYTAYIGAPYNFVPFTGKAYELKDGVVAHNEVKNSLLSGEISVRIEAISPILISDGNDHFYRDAYNRIAIPGSSFRGAIRNNVQILGAANVSDDIEDYSLMYRDVANNGLNKGRYDSILGRKTKIIDGKSKSVLEEVKAGYIIKKGRDYYIREPREDVTKLTGTANYFVVYKKNIVSENLKIDFYGGCNCRKISYIQNGKTITSIDVFERYEKKGWLIDSGYMRGKKAFYIIPQEKDSEAEDILIDKKDIDSYMIDFEKKKNVLGKKRSFYELPGNSALKPIFYIHADGRTYFGFTPYLRLFYDHTICDGIPTSMKNIKVDFSKSLFGYSTKEASYKSRLSFSDLVVEGNEVKERMYKLVLGEPKATAYMNYLVQKGETGTTYNNNEFELRGIKQYWLYNSQEGIRDNPNKSENEKVQSTLYALPESTVFTGKVRFHNLRDVELGLLLWSIGLEENSWMNIGKGKPYGLGTIKVQISDARVIDNDKAYSLDYFDISPYKVIDVKDYIDIYKKFLKDSMGIDWERDSSIKSFFIMKDSKKIPSNKETNYMALNDFKAQKKGRVSSALKDSLNIIK